MAQAAALAAKENTMAERMNDEKICLECGIRLGKHPGCEFAADDLELAHTAERCLRRQLAARTIELTDAEDECDRLTTELEQSQAAMAAMRDVVSEFARQNPRFAYNGTVQDPRGVHALLAQPNPGQPILDRLAAAEAVVGKLPKTADGVAIVPGMIVYYWDDGAIIALTVAPFYEWDTFDEDESKALPWAGDGDGTSYSGCDAYSTEAAALATKETPDG